MLSRESIVLLGLLASVAAAPWQSSGWSYSYSPSETSATAVSPTSPPAASSITTPAPTSPNMACATVSSMVAAATGSAVPTVPASVAWDCIQSVPLNALSGLELMDSIRPYLDWQTTLAYLKDPPSGYLEPAVDVLGDFDSIVSRLQSGGFINEYDFEFTLYELFQTTHDGHFRYLPSLVAAIFGFRRPLAMVSVSTDGKALPKPYVYADILFALNDTTFVPSAVAQIDGENAVTYLENWAQYGSLQDPDALFNNVMYELAQISLGTTGSGAGTFSGGGRGAYVYPGAETTLTFENGTTMSYENYARVLQDFVGINTGEDLYNTYLEPPPTTTSTTTTSPSATPTPAPGYPPPVLRQENNLIGGYYLGAAGYEDIAVLSVPSFVGLATAEESFQQVATDFITAAVAAGKTKLIIDVSANGGGTILQGYSLFKNLFPSLDPYGATRFRAQEALNLIGEVVSDVAGPAYPWNYSDPANFVLNDFLGSPFDYRADVDINGQNFQSWAEKYGPHEYHGDNFTSIIRWNLSDPTTILTSGIIVDGYQNRTTIPPTMPFAQDDIVILYDGYCASTCTIFSELMTAQGGVKTIAIGGRPILEPMQAVGGVKGTNDYPWSFIWQLVNDTLTLADNSTVATTAELEAGVLGTYDLYWNTRGVEDSGVVNSRDGIAQGDATETPLQFVYQAADCRIWYTPEMTYDVTAMWEKVADVAWGGASCVVGDVGLKKKREVEGKQRVKRGLSVAQMKELEESMSLYTDLRGEVVVGDGYMRPS